MREMYQRRPCGSKGSRLSESGETRSGFPAPRPLATPWAAFPSPLSPPTAQPRFPLHPIHLPEPQRHRHSCCCGSPPPQRCEVTRGTRGIAVISKENNYWAGGVANCQVVEICRELGRRSRLMALPDKAWGEAPCPLPSPPLLVAIWGGKENGSVSCYIHVSCPHPAVSAASRQAQRRAGHRGRTRVLSWDEGRPCVRDAPAASSWH